jgi:hypothetical protein
LAKEQLELLKAAPFYTNPGDISGGSINAMLQPGGDLDSDTGIYFQYYDPDGQPLAGAEGAAYVVRWQVEQVVQPGGDGSMPLAMFRITVRCANLARTYQYQGDATLMTFRTANIG